MGFVFSRFCHFYSMTDVQTLDMPVRRFWMMNNNINRILATKDMRALTVTNSAQSAEGAEACRKNLVLEIGDVVDQEDVLDREGLSDLRLMTV